MEAWGRHQLTKREAIDKNIIYCVDTHVGDSQSNGLASSAPGGKQF